MRNEWNEQIESLKEDIQNLQKRISENTWPQQAELVASELRRMDAEIKIAHAQTAEIRETMLPNILSQIAVLTLKCSLWGGLAGLIAVAAMALLQFLKQGATK